jgi:hypothetical protein
MFAITMTFVFLSLIALVGDADVLMVRYNQVSAEALLGAQAGATAVNTDKLYQTPPVYELDDQEAVRRCQSVIANTSTHNVTCQRTAPGVVTAVGTWQVTLPIPLFMTTATVRATRTGQAVFGGATAVTTP